MKRSKTALVVGVASVTLGALPGGAEASWPGVNGRVSLTQRVPAGEVRANRDLFAYSIGSDATSARWRLTSHSDNEEQSSWSPDGQWLAFKRSDDVWVVRWDGTGLRAVTDFPNDVNNTQPSWSPDGRQIIFRSNRALAPRNVADIWIMDRDGMNQRPLLVRAGDERYPSMSPDGTKLLFRGDWDEISGNGDEEIFTANADGSGLTQLTHNGVEDSSPNWSPDGSKIATQVAVDGTNQEIWVMNADGSNPVRLTNNAVQDVGPAWSPDGRMIAFTRSSALGSPGDVWVMNADGSGQRPLTSTDVIEESPDWQPIPVLSGVAGPRTACGDLSLEPGGVASVVAVEVGCDRATSVAERFQQRGKANGFRCTATRHSFDQTAVECAKPPAGRDREHNDQRIAFVVRDAGSPAPAADAAPRERAAAQSGDQVSAGSEED